MLLYLVVAERLSRLESNQQGTRLVVRVEDDGGDASARRRNLSQFPAPHAAILPGLAAFESRARQGGLVRLNRLVSLAVDRYELGPIGTNCYVVRADAGADEAVVVDPGAEADRLRLELARIGAWCAGILITHGHWDHLGGVADLAEGTGAKVYMPEVERITLERPDEVFEGITLRPYTPDVLLQGDETLELAGISFETLRVPGHSPGHVAYYAGSCLFSGDVLFAGSVGRTDLPFADWDTLVESIRTLCERYPPEAVVYSGHGPPTTLGAELDRNPFLAELRT